MPLALLITYVVVVCVVWTWRLTIDLSRSKTALMVAVWLPFTTCGGGTLAVRLHSLHAALILIGTAYALMLLATRGRPGRMMELDGQHFVGTLSQTYRYQLVWLGLLIPVAIVIIIFARRF